MPTGRFTALLGRRVGHHRGSDVDFLILQAQNVWIRTLGEKHRFVARGNLGWIETNNFEKVPPDLRFFAGGDRSIRGYKYKDISPREQTHRCLKTGHRLARVSVQRLRQMVGRGIRRLR